MVRGAVQVLSRGRGRRVAGVGSSEGQERSYLDRWGLFHWFVEGAP